MVGSDTDELRDQQLGRGYWADDDPSRLEERATNNFCSVGGLD